jgi:hypothetical protein
LGQAVEIIRDLFGVAARWQHQNARYIDALFPRTLVTCCPNF